MSKINELKKILQNHEKRISALEKSLSSKPRKNKQKSKKISINDLLMEIKEEGFFDKPKQVKEIVEKFKELGNVYSSDSLTSPLARAIKSRTLGRIKQDGKWGYVKR